MKITAVLVAILSLSACQRASRPAEAIGQNVVYIVPRDTGIESRALFSAKLFRWNASGLHWYATGVVRAEMSPQAIVEVKADPAVALVITDKSLSEPAHPLPVEFAPSPTASCVTPLLPPKPPAPLPNPIQPIAQVQPPNPPPANHFQGLMSVPQVPQTPPMTQVSQTPQPMTQPALQPIMQPMMQPMMQPPMMPMGGSPGIAPMMPGMGLVDTLAGGFMNKVINRPPACKISIGKKKATFSPEGGDGSIEVEASGSCAWQAQSSVEWIKILSGTGVSGTGIITYSVAPGDGAKRAGSISIVAAVNGSPIKGKATHVVNQVE